MDKAVSDYGVIIGVAAHKPYRMPEDSAYLPIQVGAALNPGTCPGFQSDDEGESISRLNASYSELTALYWLWRNVDAHAKGLIHYRRLLGSPDPVRRCAEDPFDRVATGVEIGKLVEENGVILPKRRNYYIETVYNHYSHTFDGKQFDVCRGVLSDMCPEYVPAWDRLMESRSAHIYNMFVMRADLFDAYCAWLFPILERLVSCIDTSDMTPFEARWPGRVSERLLDPWLEVNGASYIELPVVNPEPVDWPSKIGGFLNAKFFGKKYKRSF